MVLDVILVVLFLLMVLYGYKKGCIGIVASLVSTIIAFVLAYLLAGAVGDYMASTSWGMEITNEITNKFEKQEEIKIDSLDTQNKEGNMQENEAEALVDKENVQDKILGVIDNKVIQDTQNGVTSKITEYVFTSLGFVIVFFGARIVLWLLRKILEGIFELPILKTFNKLGGVITAVLLFLIEASIILAVINSISTMSFMTGVVNTIQNSIITKSLYEHNIIASLIISKII